MTSMVNAKQRSGRLGAIDEHALQCAFGPPRLGGGFQFAAIEQQLSDLHRIQGRALAQIV